MLSKPAIAFLFRIVIVSICVLMPPSMWSQSNGRSDSPQKTKVLTGQGAAGDWTTDAPGVRRRITPADMPRPFLTESVENGPKLIPRPAGRLPVVPSGFKVEEFTAGLKNPRLIRVAPNGDIFVAESRVNLVRVIRPSKDGSKTDINEIYTADLKRPFGIAFYPPGPNPQYIYI